MRRIAFASADSVLPMSSKRSRTAIPREVNDGRAEWLISGETLEGVAFEAIYDHPHGDDGGAVRIVSVWRLDF